MSVASMVTSHQAAIDNQCDPCSSRQRIDLIRAVAAAFIIVVFVLFD